MTSTAEPRERSGTSWVRTVFLVVLFLLLAWQTPMPWGALWLTVPLVVALSLMLSWRWGRWGIGVPVALFAVAMVFAGPASLWVWWLPVTALTGAWMGLREEGGGPPSGQRAWMMLPVLALAAGLPWMLSYPELVSQWDRAKVLGDQQFIAWSREIGTEGDRLQSLQRSIAESAAIQRRLLPRALPSVLFVWMALLVVVGRGLSARLAGVLRWPKPSRARWADWRLPDAALWLFLLGLALIVTRRPEWSPTAWTLLVAIGLGYGVQGIAVVRSLLLARGVPSHIIILTLLFVLAMAAPVFVLSSVCVGLSDVWLDYRRLEAVPDGDQT